MDLQKQNNVISAILIVIIVVLSVWLYQSITGPYKKVLQEKKRIAMVHVRMGNIRKALIEYKNQKGHFPSTLDSLAIFLKTDTAMVRQGASMFKQVVGEYNPDSLIYTPYTPRKKFKYALNDSTNPELYLLVDPQDTTQRIGSLTKITLLNAASWD